MRTKKIKRRMFILPDGFQIREEGVLKATVQLQGIQNPMAVLFHVVNMAIPPIIGYDVLKENNITINFGEGTISHQPPFGHEARFQECFLSSPLASLPNLR